MEKTKLSPDNIFENFWKLLKKKILQHFEKNQQNHENHERKNKILRNYFFGNFRFFEIFDFFSKFPTFLFFRCFRFFSRSRFFPIEIFSSKIVVGRIFFWIKKFSIENFSERIFFQPRKILSPLFLTHSAHCTANLCSCSEIRSSGSIVVLNTSELYDARYVVYIESSNFWCHQRGYLTDRGYSKSSVSHTTVWARRALKRWSTLTKVSGKLV